MPRGPHRQGAKPADPLLEKGREADPLKPFGLPRWAGLLLYAAFWFLLAIPLVRRWRRRPWWNAARLLVGALALIPFAVWALAGRAPSFGWLAPSGALFLFTLVCGPAADPDRERKLQRRYGAQYLLNGGRLVAGRLPNSVSIEGEPLFLLIRGEHLLLVPRTGRQEMHSALDVRRIRGIRIGGEPYVPVYVSEAKDPPVKETVTDRNATLDLELELDEGNVVRFRYQGAFRKHLAETAAHAIHSVRERLVRPQPAELLRRAAD